MVMLFNCELETFHQLYRSSKLAVRAHTEQPIICDEMLAIIVCKAILQSHNLKMLWLGYLIVN
jgi:hypothetical protein